MSQIWNSGYKLGLELNGWCRLYQPPLFLVAPLLDSPHIVPQITDSVNKIIISFFKLSVGKETFFRGDSLFSVREGCYFWAPLFLVLYRELRGQGFGRNG